jgi:hypothetical protein
MVFLNENLNNFKTPKQIGFLDFIFSVLLILIIVLLTLLIFSCRKTDEEIIPETAADKNYSLILGRPTNSSVTLSTIFNRQTEVYFEYGSSKGTYSFKTSTYNLAENLPLDTELSGLTSNTQYYYRIRYRSFESETFVASPEHTFVTQRPSGVSFTFAIEADPHLDSNSDTASFALTLKNILAANPDFMLDLGDTFMSEKQSVIDQKTVTERHLLYRPYFDKVCNSVPLYLVIGNHEGELGWKLDGTANSIAVIASNTRKLYYPNPVPNSFYSGNTKEESLVGLRQNYYSWEWGNALFIVLDPYWNTVRKPGWGWTLGAEQYNWFKSVISKSNARYKFVFAHNLVGGNGNDARGGSEFAHLYEMGGSNLDGTPGFDTNRPGWGKPIQTLMKENNATIFFHGHDHFYGKQDKDGVVYQEVPQPSNISLTNISAAQYGYFEGVLLPGRGYLLVTVSDSNVKVEYIGTFLPKEESATRHNGMVITSYTIN